MKKIVILVDDDVEYIEFTGYVNDSVVFPDIYDESFNELDVWNVKIHRNKNKKSDLLGNYPAIPLNEN